MDVRDAARPAALHDARTRRPATAFVAAVAYVWIRTAILLTTPAFETPDTSSYRSGQATRPPMSSALLSLLGDTTYVAVSALVSSLGFAALCWALWDPSRRRWSMSAVAAVVTVSMLPMVTVYEHWLIPESLLVGLSLLCVSIAWRSSAFASSLWLLIGLCWVVVLTKEVGIGVAVLVGLLLAVGGARRLAAVMVLTSVLFFVVAVMPASNREGRVFTGQPLTTELTMQRTRVMIAGLLWSDLSDELEAVRQEAVACGMTRNQLIAETFGITDDFVDFSTCRSFLESVDQVSQLDLLSAHVRDPRHVPESIRRGFAADMGSMAYWSGARLDGGWVMTVDRAAAVVVALTPLAALTVATARRRGRLLAMIAVTGSAMAVVAVLVDPSSQERHSLVFRLAAFAIGLIALGVSTAVSGPAAEVQNDLAGDETVDTVGARSSAPATSGRLE